MTLLPTIPRRAHGRAQNRLARAVRLVQKRFNTGLADARNVGTRLARAPYVFMMDADNLVTPARSVTSLQHNGALPICRRL